MATRSPFFWPFLSTSIWNQPIGTNAVYVNAKLPPRGKTAISAEKIAMNMDTTQPVVPVWQNGGQHDTNRCTGSLGLFSPAINIPYNQSLIIPSSGLNYPGAFIGSDSATRWEAGNFAHCTNGGKVTAGHMKNSGTVTDAGLGGASGGSGLSTLGGTIRYGEFTHGTNGTGDGVIRHALRFNLYGQTDLSSAGSGFRWPATSADGGYKTPGSNNFYGGSVPQAVEGSLFAIPQSINLSTLGLSSTPGHVIAQTLQNYGGYVCNDSAPGFTWPICVELSQLGDVTVEFQNFYGFAFGGTAGGANKWANDCAIILANLYVVDNNTPTNIGGGGAPLQPLAPSFGAALSPPFLQQVNGNTTSAAGTLPVANAATTLGSTLSLVIGVRAPVVATTPAQVGASWTNTPQSGTANTTIVLPAHTITGGNYVTFSISNRVATVGSIASVVGTLGNTYALIPGAAVSNSTDVLRLEVWGGHVSNGGSETVTVTFAGTGAGAAIASEWQGTGETLDVAAVINATQTATQVQTGSSAQTGTTGDLVIASYAVQGNPVTITSPAFSPAGTTLNVPDITNQVTGGDNHLLGVSQQISGAAGIAQSFTANTTTGTFVSVLICLTPAGGSGSAPTASIAGGGTWAQRFSVNSPTGLGNLSGWDLTPTGTLPANDITISSTSSTGSIEYEFYEMTNVIYQSTQTATGTSTAPTVTLTPTLPSDCQVGGIFWPNASATITPTTPGTWENDATTVGIAANAGSSIVSGGNVSNSGSAQTYSGTLSPSAPWVAGIMDYEVITVPSQVSQPTINAGAAQVSVNWLTPANNGSAISSYTVKVYSGVAADGTGGTLANTITGIAVIDYSIVPYVVGSLSNGTRYAVSVTAINGIGPSVESQRSIGATPVAATTVPGTPVAPSVVIGDTTATVTITPPATGGLPITGYTFNCYQPFPTLFTTQTQLSNVFTFSGLTDGIVYGFTGIAINGNGNSVESPLTLATPLGAPATPNAPTCVPGDSEVTVTGAVPANNGSPITTYEFNCYNNPSSAPLFTQTQAAPVATFLSLSNGTTYFFTMLATNAIGTSLESSATPATPIGAPGPPVPGPGHNVQQGTTYQYVYKGKTTGMLYKFAPISVPPALLDQYGNLLEYGTYNGETLVFTPGGQIRRSVKGSPGPTDPYGFGVSPSPWESNV